ncbi:MAG: hypothetical protein CALGDGBN_02995 [Pseudomonadales bacterium]|nr:hypothetical protein [Pseudomonadales bacterium]
MKIRSLFAAALIGAVYSSALHAAVSAEQAARLGADLTPVGAERAGNADGSIPAWDGKGTPVPAGWKPGDDYRNPFPDEKPLYSVTADNMAQYQPFLAEGVAALLDKWGKQGFRLDVYPTHRNSIQPQWFFDGTRKNAADASLVADGQKIEGNVAGVPFPLPQSGVEALWNHMLRFQGFQAYFKYNSYYVDANGKQVLSTTAENYIDYPMYIDQFKQRNYSTSDLRYTFLRINYLAPARRAGEILLVHEPGADYTAGKGRDAWQYLTGQRRVRKAPAVSFDTPNPATAGMSTYDDAYMYNGSPERFEWTLVGKKEIFLPYNTYVFSLEKNVEEMMDKHFFKPEFVRWEKHRVWIVEGKLKAGSRHIYSKRRYYLDEDTWAGLIGETWDGQGKLWRVQLMYPHHDWDVPSPANTGYGGYDLISNIYNINSKPIPGTYRNTHDASEQYFTAQGMARTGIR